LTPLFRRFSDNDLRVYLQLRDLKCHFWPVLDAFLNVLLDVDFGRFGPDDDPDRLTSSDSPTPDKVRHEEEEPVTPTLGPVRLDDLRRFRPEVPSLTGP
jgi:hypothetical protein